MGMGASSSPASIRGAHWQGLPSIKGLKTQLISKFFSFLEVPATTRLLAKMMSRKTKMRRRCLHLVAAS